MITDTPIPDPLSQSVALLRPQALAWRVIEAHPPWAIRFPAVEAVVFGQMIEGHCLVDLPDGSATSFAAGDFILLSSPSAWVARTDDGGRPVDFLDIIEDPRRLLSPGAPSAAMRFFAGAFLLRAPNPALLASLMPPVIHLRGTETVTGRLSRLQAMLGAEAMADRPGKSLVLDRLLEVMLVEALRCQPMSEASPRPGLIAGLEDTKLGPALRLMHDGGETRWTVTSLARQVGMSRSAFAAHFTSVMGIAPMSYLLNWRLNQAKSALSASKTPLYEIAEQAGYQSVSAFSTAFRRVTGLSPTAYALAARGAATTLR